MAKLKKTGVKKSVKLGKKQMKKTKGGVSSSSSSVAAGATWSLGTNVKIF